MWVILLCRAVFFARLYPKAVNNRDVDISSHDERKGSTTSRHRYNAPHHCRSQSASASGLQHFSFFRRHTPGVAARGYNDALAAIHASRQAPASSELA
jgi:hypothetical protein